MNRETMFGEQNPEAFAKTSNFPKQAIKEIYRLLQQIHFCKIENPMSE
jgi:hypothetical protein